MADIENQEFNIDFTHYIDVLLRRRWIILSSWVVVFLSVTLYVFTTRPVFEAASLLVIEKERGGATLTGDAMTVENSNDDYYQTQYKLLKSGTLLQQVYDKLGLDKTEDFAQPRGVRKLDGALTIVPVLRSRLVYVKAASHDAQLAVRISNALAQGFVEQNLGNQLFISKDVLQALQIRQDDAHARKMYAGLPAVVNNPLIQTLKAEYAKLQAQSADLASRYTPQHPAIIAVQSHMAALEGQIQSETEKIVQSLKTELSGQLRGNNVRVVDPAALPEKPIKPRKLRMLALGLLLGLAFGVAAALLVETLDQTIRSQEDVEQKLSFPFLGLIPFSSGSGPAYEAMVAKELSLSSEAVRNLRTMVDFAGMSQKSKAILVTSTVQNEGKTFVSSNLAVAFAQLGESVLVVNGDLRRPSVHKNFAVSSERGISDFLALGQDVKELGALVRPTEVPNVSLLPCGPRPPNPSELLNTARLGALIAWAKENYDRVVIDCTPIFPIHDTLLWGRHVGSAVFIVRYGATRVPLILKAGQRLESAGIKILGAVVNAARPEGLTYASYGYYYHAYYQPYEART